MADRFAGLRNGLGVDRRQTSWMLTHRSASMLLVAATSIAIAQSVPQAMAYVRESTAAVKIVLRGTDSRFGGKRFRTELVFQDGGQLQAEILEYSGPISTPDVALPYVRRLAGDGTNFWFFHALRNEYRSVRYGAINAPTPATYRADFFKLLNLDTRDQSAPATRILTEIFSGTASAYRPWIPSASALSYPVASFADDLVPARVYNPIPGTLAFAYLYEPTMSRDVAFQLESTSTGRWNLAAAYGADLVGGGLREWSLTLDLAPTILANQFAFVPPVNARPIANTGGR